MSRKRMSSSRAAATGAGGVAVDAALDLSRWRHALDVALRLQVEPLAMTSPPDPPCIHVHLLGDAFDRVVKQTGGSPVDKVLSGYTKRSLVVDTVLFFTFDTREQ